MNETVGEYVCYTLSSDINFYSFFSNAGLFEEVLYNFPISMVLYIYGVIQLPVDVLYSHTITVAMLVRIEIWKNSYF